MNEYQQTAKLTPEQERIVELEYLNAELLAALKKFTEYGDIFRWDPRLESNSPYRKAMAVIAKAEGML